MKNILSFAVLFAMLGFSLGYIVKEYFLTKPCPACICPECPPQTVLYINNEKIKAKGGGAIDLTNILKDNKIINNVDTTSKNDTTSKKKRGVLNRIFKKNNNERTNNKLNR